MKKICFALLNLMFIFSVSAAKFNDGKEYVTLTKPIASHPQVLEFFSFFCPHCYQFACVYHVSDALKKNLPADIKVIKYHVDFLGGDLGPVVTHVWAVAMILGVEDKVTAPIFKDIQKTKTITNAVGLKKIFIKAAGISSKDYDTMWNSFAVKALVAQQQKAASDFSLESVPAIFVNGKYMVNNGGLNISNKDSFVDDYINIVTFLVEKK